MSGLVDDQVGELVVMPPEPAFIQRQRLLRTMGALHSSRGTRRWFQIAISASLLASVALPKLRWMTIRSYDLQCAIRAARVASASDRAEIGGVALAVTVTV